MIARIAAVALTVCMFVGLAHAGPTEAEAKAAGRQVLIALRILAYDKQLADRSPGAMVTFAIVSSPTPEGRAARARYEAGFALMPKVKVGGRAVKIVSVDASDKIAATLIAKAPSVVFVVDDLGDKLAPLRTATRTRHILSMSLREGDVSRGLSVGIVAARERDQIVINLEASRTEGVRFGAGLLQLARLVEESR